MTNILTNGDVVVVKFPFASSLKYKARPAVIISTENYNKYSRDTFLILAISSQVSSKLSIEKEIKFYTEAGLLKPSIFKSSIATIESTFIIQKLGSLTHLDRVTLKTMLKNICDINLG